MTAVNDITAFGELRVLEGDISTNAPVLYYSFNAPQGDLVKDDSLQLNSGTSLGAVWTTPGQVGDGAYSFAGTNDYINVNFGSSLELTGPFSLAAWIKPSVASQPGAPGIITKGANSTSVVFGLMWHDSAGGQVGFYSTGGIVRYGLLMALFLQVCGHISLGFWKAVDPVKPSCMLMGFCIEPEH